MLCNVGAGSDLNIWYRRPPSSKMVSDGKLFSCVSASHSCIHVSLLRGSNSMVECQLPKLNVEGSIPFSRSTFWALPHQEGPFFIGYSWSSRKRHPHRYSMKRREPRRAKAPTNAPTNAPTSRNLTSNCPRMARNCLRNVLAVQPMHRSGHGRDLSQLWHQLG
jgi:hypothetical protein